MNFRKDREPLALQVIACFKKENRIYEFKKGEPMCLYYTCHPSTLEINNKLIESPVRQDKARSFTHRW